jgi:hypothetical protein
MTSPAEQDVRTHLTLLVLAFDCWAIQALGRSQNSLDRNIEAWRKEGCPPHPMVSRVVPRMRDYVSRLGTAPELPASVLSILNKPVTPTLSDALPQVSASESEQPDGENRSQSHPKHPAA